MGSVYRIELDGEHIQSKQDFFRQLSAATGIEHVDNLDALSDDLTGEIPLCCGPYEIIWKNADKSDWSGHADVIRILGVLTYEQQAFSQHFSALRLEFGADPGADTWSFPQMYDAPHYREERRKRGLDD